MKNILIPVDGSEYSMKAIDAAKEIAKAFDSKISILSVVTPELKISSHEVTASGPDSDVMASVTFSAQKDARSGTSKSIVVSRIDAV